MKKNLQNTFRLLFMAFITASVFFCLCATKENDVYANG